MERNLQDQSNIKIVDLEPTQTGLNDGQLRTLEEIGEELEVTREWVRQIETKALIRLRHSSKLGRFRSYLNQG